MMRKIVLLLVTMNLFTLSYSQINFTKVIQKIGSSLEVVDIGDINNDGLDDVVVGAGFYFDDVNDYNLFIYYQNTDGTLQNPIKVKYPDSYPGLSAIDIADLNNDTLNDVVISYGDYIGIFFQNQQGNLESIKSYNSVSGTGKVDGLKTGDLNNDGLKDIAVCHWGGKYIRVFFQTSTGTFQIKDVQIQSAGYDELDIADMNNDGLDDIVFMPGQLVHSSLQILYQDVSLGITDSVYLYKYPDSYFPTFQGIGLGDLNNDGLVDVVGSQYDKTILLFQSKDNTIGDSILVIGSSSHAVEIADLNCDGINDIIAQNKIYYRNGLNDQYIGMPNSSYSNINPHSLAIGDINNDNKPDIVSVGLSAVVFLYNSSKPTTFLDIDTTIFNLNIKIDTITSNSSYQVIDIDSTSDCHIKNIYNFQVSTINKYEKHVGDSAFIRFGSLCDNEYKDTVLVSFDYTLKSIISSDTVKTFISTDTIVYNNHFSSSFIQNDTTDLWTELEIDTLRLEDITMSNDTVFIQVDSVEVTNRRLFIKSLNSYFYIYEGIKCGEQHFDTMLIGTNEKVDVKLIFTDTLLISSSVEIYPAGTFVTENIVQDFLIYPNPAHHFLKISFLDQNLNKGEFRIINLSGQIEMIESFNNKNELNIDLSKINVGLHFVEVLIDNKKMKGRFIKY